MRDAGTPRPDRPLAAGAVILATAALALALFFYHPYYFGDELYEFNVSPRGGGLLATFHALNAYKPRLLVNLLWGAVVAGDLPRWVPMLVFAGSLGIAAGLFLRLARVELSASAGASMLAAFLIVVSRFDIMLYFDYVSGTVEALALMLFLLGLSLLADPILHGRGTARLPKLMAGLLAWLLVVSVHERYIAAFAGMSAVYLVRVFVVDGGRNAARQLPFAASLVAMPVLLYVVLVKWLAQTSITTGTSNMEVSFGLQTAKVAGTYVSNLMLGSNFGPAWFVGNLNSLHPSHPTVFAISAILAALAWLLPLFRRCDRQVADGNALWAAAVLGVGALAMVIVASLPGADRQEARWMLPVLALMMLAVLSAYRTKSALVLIALLALSQLFYGAFGGLQTIANIQASRTARALASAINTIDPPGVAGAMLLVPEPDTSWVLGMNGREFCRLNLRGTNCLYPKRTASAMAPGQIDFGVSSTAMNPLESPRFRIVGDDLADATLHPEAITGGRLLGNAGDWPGWVRGPNTQASARGLLVTAMGDTFLKLPVGGLGDGLLVYSARSAAGGAAALRLQVNWHDARDAFVSAQIEVVETSAIARNYATGVSPPPGAAYGYVYATLHEPTAAGVLIESIRLVPP